MLIPNSFYSDFGHKSIWRYARKGNVMLFVYIISLLSSVLFGYSLRSFWAGVLGFVLVLSCCDLAVNCAEQGQYVGPVHLVNTLDKAIDELSKEMAVAEKKAAAYDRCMHHFHGKAWGANQVIPSHRSLHNQCLKVAAERSLP